MSRSGRMPSSAASCKACVEMKTAFAGVCLTWSLVTSAGVVLPDWKTAFRQVGFDPDAPGSSYFLVTSDIHAPNCSDKLSAHVRTWNVLEPKPSLLAVLGDFGYVNRFFGHRPTSAEADRNARKTLEVAKTILGRLRPDIPQVYVVGNHDTYPGEAGRKVWHEIFPDQPPYGEKDLCGIRFVKWDGGVDGIIDGEQERWIVDTCAKYPKDRTLVVLVHQPSVGAVGMERDIGRLAKRALAGRNGDTWLLAGHEHSNSEVLWSLPGGGRLMVAGHTRDRDGWWAYGVRDGRIVARIFKPEDREGFVVGRMPKELKSRGEIPLAYEGNADVVWSCFVGDREERAARLSIGKTGDIEGAFFYVDKLVYRFSKSVIAPRATRLTILGNLGGNRKTKAQGRCRLSGDGTIWTEVPRLSRTGEINEFSVPPALVNVRDLYVQYESFGFDGDESVSGFAFSL